MSTSARGLRGNGTHARKLAYLLPCLLFLVHFWVGGEESGRGIIKSTKERMTAGATHRVAATKFPKAQPSQPILRQQEVVITCPTPAKRPYALATCTNTAANHSHVLRRSTRHRLSFLLLLLSLQILLPLLLLLSLLLLLPLLLLSPMLLLLPLLLLLSLELRLSLSLPLQLLLSLLLLLLLQPRHGSLLTRVSKATVAPAAHATGGGIVAHGMLPLPARLVAS